MHVERIQDDFVNRRRKKVIIQGAKKMNVDVFSKGKGSAFNQRLERKKELQPVLQITPPLTL